MLHVASVCTHCCVLLHAAAQSLKPVKRLAQCWELLRPLGRSFTDHRNDVKMLKLLAAFTWVLDIKPRANGHNIVGCYMLPPFAHPVTCCCVLLGVVPQSLKPVKLLAACKLAQQLPTPTMLRPFAGGFMKSFVCSTGVQTMDNCCLFVVSICLRVLPSSSSQRPETRATKWGSFLRVPDLSRTESLTLMISSPRWTPL